MCSISRTIPVKPLVFFIPVSDWNGLKSKYAEINEETNIPEFHKEVVRNRMSEYNKNSEMGLDYDKVMTELKSE